jgi:rfaE bifunctional protein nucleotidyltransferase chain/domain
VIVVLANGVFDILHAGHVRHLEEARSFGTHLIVSLTTDEHVNKGPGRPLNTWKDRREVLEALRCVDEVIPTVSACDAIRRVAPDIFVKGIDYAGGKFSEDVFAACGKAGASIRYTTSPKMSATDIIMRTRALETR